MLKPRTTSNACRQKISITIREKLEYETKLL